MSSLLAIITAFNKPGPRLAELDIPLSAQIPIRGKPMLEWVVDALRKSSQISSITVIGPESLDEMLCMRYVDRRLVPFSASFETILSMVRPEKNETNNPDGYLIVPCEAVYLTPEVLNTVLPLALRDPHDLVFPLVSPDIILQHPEFSLKNMSLDGKAGAPGVMAITKKAQFLAAAFAKLRYLHKDENLLQDSGLTQPLFTVLEKQLEKPEITEGYIETAYPEIALSVTDSEMLRKAESTLPQPFSPPFPEVKILLNPKSGKGLQLPGYLKKLFGIRKRSLDLLQTSEEYQERIRQYLHELGVHAEFLVSKSAADATRIARRCAAEGCPMVIAAGGDGTINSVVNGLAGSETVFGAIPLGTVNVFALQLEIPMEIRAACELIARGNVRRIDLGKINNTYFTSIAGIGFDAYVIMNANPELKKKLGAGAYVLTGISNMMKYRFRKIFLTIDNLPIRRSGYVVIIGNGKFYSANMVISPLASLDDGLLDVIIFKNRNIIDFLRYLRGIQKGNLTDFPDVEYHQGKTIAIERHGHHYIHMDGEHYGHTPATISVAPSSLKVVC